MKIDQLSSQKRGMDKKTFYNKKRVLFRPSRQKKVTHWR